MRRMIDPEEVRKLNQEGLDDDAISKRLGFSKVSVGHVRRTLNLPLPGRGSKPSGNGSALVHKAQRKAAIVESHLAEPIQEPAAVQEAQPGVAVPQAKARVVMFEISGGNETILAAIETVKAALAR